jgi:PAS domain S-box-containing protein
MLTDFAIFLLDRHLDALVAEKVRLLYALDAPLTRPEYGLDAADVTAYVTEALSGALTAMGEGRGLAYVEARLRRWSTEGLAGLPQNSAQAGDAILIATAQEQALSAFVGHYSRDPAVILALGAALRVHYVAVQKLAFAAFARIAQSALAHSARLEVAQEVASVYARDLEALNQRLEAEATRKRAIIEAAIDAVVTIDQHNTVLEFNPAAERMFGYGAAEVLGRDMTTFLVPERFREAHQRGIKHFLATGEGPALSKRVELPALRRDGSEFPAEFAIIHLGLEGQVAFTSFIRDMSEHKAAEAARQQLEAMKQADVLKDQFLGILSHELRTPINAITGFGSVLDDGAAGEMTETQRRYVKRMLASADSLLALVNDLLDMSRIQAGKFSLSARPVSLPTTVREVLAMLAPLAEQRHHQLIDEVPADLPTLLADPQRVSQVIANYLNNAIKFTPDGGTIRVRARVDGEVLRCEVQDSGEGIAAADLPKLFQRFGQLDMGNTRKANGAGLGLSISKALIEAHGGAVGVASRPGEGATFWFTLPLQAAPAETLESANP